MFIRQVLNRYFTLYYAKSHEWVDFDESAKTATIGITDTAQSLLGDIVYLELPEVGDAVSAGDELGTIESVKTADAVITPVTGTVLEVNESINDSPEILNTSAEDEGWIAKLSVDNNEDFLKLLDRAGYDKWVEEDYHNHH